MPLILFDEEIHLLGMQEMDATHLDFVQQLNALENMPTTELAIHFSALLAHTIAHFDREDALMLACQFPHISEHRAEHRKVLAEMQRFAGQLEQGKTVFARSYIRERLPDWFRLHLASMDSALVWHLKTGEYRSPDL